MSAAYDRRRTASDPATPRRHQPAFGDSEDEYQANQCPSMKRPASPDATVERPSRRQSWTYTQDHGNNRHPVGCQICDDFEDHCDDVRVNESRAYNRARDEERSEIGRGAYDRGYKRGWRECEDSIQAQGASDQEELQRLRTKVQLLHEENARQAAQLQREQREEREVARRASLQGAALADDQLRQRAIESRSGMGGPSFGKESTDVEMYDGTAASIHAPRYNESPNQASRETWAPRGPRGGQQPVNQEQRNGRYDRGSGNSSDKLYRQDARSYGPPAQHSFRPQVAPPVRSGQGGRATGQDKYEKYNSKQKHRQRDQRGAAPPADTAGEQERVMFRFEGIPQSIEEVRNVVRQAECATCHLPVWRSKQWREEAQKKEPHMRTAAEQWLLENWTTPMWYKDERKSIYQNGKPYRGNTPPNYLHPIDHWFGFFSNHRYAIRQGVRRLPDGKPDVEVLEGFLMATQIARPDEAERANNRKLIFERLAGLCADPAVYSAALDRLALEPMEDLSLKPYAGPYPPSADSICRHMSFCGIRAWDVQASFRAWAHEWLQATERATAHVAAAQPMDAPTMSAIEDEAPNVAVSGTAPSGAENGNINAAEVGVTQSLHQDDVDMGVELPSVSATVA